MVPNYKRANYVGLRDRLESTNWRVLLSSKSIESMWLKFMDVIGAGVKGFVPLQKRRVGQGILCMWFMLEDTDKQGTSLARPDSVSRSAVI